MNYTVNPIQVCTQLYGSQNIQDVRDCVMDSIYRFYGPMCDFHQAGLYKTVQSYMVEIIKNGGRDPRSLRLPLSVPLFQPRFFMERYLESLNKEDAYQQCLIDCRKNKDCMKMCYIDKNAIQ